MEDAEDDIDAGDVVEVIDLDELEGDEMDDDGAEGLDIHSTLDMQPFCAPHKIVMK